MEKVSLLQDQIADAAVALFREKGYEGVSVGEICAAAGIARDAGIEFVVETHDAWTDTARLRAAFDAAGRPEGVALLWDVHHPWATRGEAPAESARNLSPYLRNTHWKDSRPSPEGGRRLCLPGEGDVPLRDAFAALRAVGYDGWYTLEWEKRWHPEIEEPEVAFPAFAAYMRSLGDPQAPAP